MRPVLPRASALEWFFLAGGLFFAWRYFFFYDDCFVYFRYVDNFLFLKLGLVYNAGELVEGYSSPLWALGLLVLRATELPWTVLVRGLSLAGVALFWWTGVVANRRLSPAGAAVNLPLAFALFLYPVACYFSSGLETTALQVLAPVYALFFLRPGSAWLAVPLALSPLVRHELALPFAVAVAWSWIVRRRVPWLLMGVGAAFGTTWVAFRVWYYADLFPNTFHLKNGTDFGQGWTYLMDTLTPYGVPWIAAVAVVVAVILRRRAGLELRARAAMLVAAGLVAVYVVKIGGAPIHYRYLAFPFCLAAFAAGGLAEHALEATVPAVRARLAPVLGLAAAFGSALLYPRQLDRHPLRSDPGVTYVDEIYEAAYHRGRIGVDGAKWQQVTPDGLRAWRREHPDVYRETLADGWCLRAYRKFDARVVHAYGLTDALLARVDAAVDRPGHKRLGPLADQLVEVVAADETPDAGLFRRAVEAGRAPHWIADQLDTVEVVARKVYNRHDWSENLRLAFTFPPRLAPPRLEPPRLVR